MNDEKKIEKSAPRVKVKLKAEHTHAGIEHKPGAALELRKDQAERLIKANRAVAA